MCDINKRLFVVVIWAREAAKPSNWTSYYLSVNVYHGWLYCCGRGKVVSINIVPLLPGLCCWFQNMNKLYSESKWAICFKTRGPWSSLWNLWKLCLFAEKGWPVLHTHVLAKWFKPFCVTCKLPTNDAESKHQFVVIAIPWMQRPPSLMALTVVNKQR